MKPRKMKDSGIPWIGEIPEGWEVKRLKTFAAINPQIELDPDEFHEDAEVSFIPMENLRAGFHAITPIDFSKVKTGYVSFAEGDILMAKVTPCYENGNIAVARNLANGIGFGSTEILVFRTTDIDRQFLFYYLQNPAFKGKAISEMYGVAGLKRLTPSFFENSHYPYPTRSEQERIAAYLDEKCGEIDRVIAAKERQNELLRDQRAAVIHEAVTKGLNTKAKFKESEIEWAGRIPKNWGIKKIKYLANMQSGEMIPAAEIDESGDYPVYGGNGLRGYTGKYTHEGFRLLIGRQGALCGNVRWADGKYWASEHAVVATLLKECYGWWLYYLLTAMDLNRYSESAAQPGISVDRIINLKVPVPDYPEEQQQIAAHLDARCGEIDRVMAANEEMVAKLKEYRASLIWEAVTGKVAV